jgi:hypothetical protein
MVRETGEGETSIQNRETVETVTGNVPLHIMKACIQGE